MKRKSKIIIPILVLLIVAVCVTGMVFMTF